MQYNFFMSNKNIQDMINEYKEYNFQNTEIFTFNMYTHITFFSTLKESINKTVPKYHNPTKEKTISLGSV